MATERQRPRNPAAMRADRAWISSVTPVVRIGTHRVAGMSMGSRGETEGMASTWKNLRRDALRGARLLLLRGNRFLPVYKAGQGAYRGLAHLVHRAFSSLPGCRSVYLAHGMAQGEVYPGLSDFDLNLVFDDRDSASFEKEVRRRWRTLVAYLPVRDLSLFSVTEFEQWQRLGGGWEPLDELAHWRCLWGEDLRLPRLDPSTPWAETDRQRSGFGYYRQLLSAGLKEHPATPYLALSQRRQLYKSFGSTVFAFEPELLAMAHATARMQRWIESHPKADAAVDLARLHRARFQSGELSNLRFRTAALAYRVVDAAVSRQVPFARPCFEGPLLSEPGLPPSNLEEATRRAASFAGSLSQVAAEGVDSVVLSSSGPSRGYALFVILRDGLSDEKLLETLREIHLVFRIHDDPWLNERFPAKVPIVYSRAMFARHHALWPFDRAFLLSHGRVLHGPDPRAAAVAEAKPDAREDSHLDAVREVGSLRRYVRNIGLERSEPALFDAVTLYVPRLEVHRQLGVAPATAEEAVARLEGLDAGGARESRRFLERFGSLDVSGLRREVDDASFDRAWGPLHARLEEAA